MLGNSPRQLHPNERAEMHTSITKSVVVDYLDREENGGATSL